MTLARTVQDSWEVGSQQDVAPHLIDPRGFYQAINCLLDDDGSIYRRGGSTQVSTGTFGTHMRFVWNGYLQGGRRTVIASEADFGVMAANGVTPVNLGGPGYTYPKAAAEIEGMLFMPPGYIYAGSRKTTGYSTGTATFTNGSKVVTGSGTLWTANADAGMLMYQGAGRVYAVASVDSNTQITLRSAYEEATNSGHAYTLAPLYDITSASGSTHRASSYYAVAGERLITLEAPATIRFTEPLKPGTFSATIQPSGTVVENKHVLGDGQEVLGFRALGPDRLLVFTTDGITSISNFALGIVDDFGASQHTIDRLSREIILWGDQGIAGWRNALIVPGQDDVYLIDGSSEPDRISRSIAPVYRQHVRDGHTPGLAFVHRDHYFLPILDVSGTPVDLLVCRLDRPTSVRGDRLWPWTFMDGAGAQIAAGCVRGTTSPGTLPDLAAAGDDGNLLDLSTYFHPSDAVKSDHDATPHRFELVTRDYATGDNSINRARRLRLQYELEDAASDDPRIYLDIGTGLATEAPQWDEVTWDDFEWAAADEVEWTQVAPEGAIPNAGLQSVYAQNAWPWLFTRRARYVRFRLRTADPAARLTIRAVELFVAQSGGVRLSKVA